MVQPTATAVYTYLREWAGEEVTVDFAERMSNAPQSHIRAMMDGWPSPSSVEQSSGLDSLLPGQVRPVISEWSGTGQMVASALRILLYSPSVVVEGTTLRPFAPFESDPWISPQEVYIGLRTLATVHPFVVTGELMFTQRKPGIDQARMRTYMSAMNVIPPDEWDQDDLFSFLPPTQFGNLLASPMLAVEENTATPLALSHNEELAYRALFTGHEIDGRRTLLTTLARLSVPDFTTDTTALVSLRRSSSALAQMRIALSSALSQVAQIPEGPTATTEAGAIIADELQNSLSKFENESMRSPALQALRSGFKRLTYAGINAGIGSAITSVNGNPALGAVVGMSGATAVNGVETIRDYLSNLHNQRRAKAIWGVVMSFRT